MKRNYKLIIIEDDPYWQELLSELIEDQGWSVKIYSNLSDASKALSTELFHFATVDLRLLLDRDKNIGAYEEWGGWNVLNQVKQQSLNS